MSGIISHCLCSCIYFPHPETILMLHCVEYEPFYCKLPQENEGFAERVFFLDLSHVIGIVPKYPVSGYLFSLYDFLTANKTSKKRVRFAMAESTV